MQSIGSWKQKALAALIIAVGAAVFASGIVLYQISPQIQAKIADTLLLATTRPTGTSNPTGVSSPGQYLALGDSITFGWSPQSDFSNANNSVGYPTAIANAYALTLENIACPGTTSDYAISTSGVDWNCASYSAQYPLHVYYTGSQLDYAIYILKTTSATQRKSVHLISIMLGFNDMFRIGVHCSWSATCIQTNMPATLATLGRNIDRIYNALRATGYTGLIITPTYYAINTDPAMIRYIQSVNSVIRQHAITNNTLLVDEFTAFQNASRSHAGDPCAAGLLARTSSPTKCDLHPSLNGQSLLALTILNTISGTDAEQPHR